MELFANVDKTFWSKGRLETFTNWPFKSDVSCNPTAMATAGFFAVPGAEEPDLAECFICGKQLDGWEATDDPWEEHKSHQSDCHFVRLNKKEETEWTVEESFELLKEFYKKKCERRSDAGKEKLEKEVKTLSSEIPKIIQKTRKNTKSLK